MSSMYTIVFGVLSIMFIAHWNEAGVLRNPNGHAKELVMYSICTKHGFWNGRFRPFRFGVSQMLSRLWIIFLIHVISLDLLCWEKEMYNYLFFMTMRTIFDGTIHYHEYLWYNPNSSYFYGELLPRIIFIFL